LPALLVFAVVGLSSSESDSLQLSTWIAMRIGQDKALIAGSFGMSI
jgi:hypothetical protein